jgi:hypothetical protein
MEAIYNSLDGMQMINILVMAIGYLIIGIMISKMFNFKKRK